MQKPSDGWCCAKGLPRPPEKAPPRPPWDPPVAVPYVRCPRANPLAIPLRIPPEPRASGPPPPPGHRTTQTPVASSSPSRPAAAHSPENRRTIPRVPAPVPGWPQRDRGNAPRPPPDPSSAPLAPGAALGHRVPAGNKPARAPPASAAVPILFPRRKVLQYNPSWST